MERSTADTKKEVLSSHLVELSRPSLTTVRLSVMEGVMRMASNTTGREVYQFFLRAIIDAFSVLCMRSQIPLLEGV